MKTAATSNPTHHGRAASACGAPGKLTLRREKVTCHACRVELSGRDLLRYLRQDMEVRS